MRLICSALAGLVLFLGFSLNAEDRAAYGKYLIEEIGKCQDYHTPKLETSEYLPAEAIIAYVKTLKQP